MRFGRNGDVAAIEHLRQPIGQETLRVGLLGLS